jgi:hypothetical protein
MQPSLSWLPLLAPSPGSLSWLPLLAPSPGSLSAHCKLYLDQVSGSFSLVCVHSLSMRTRVAKSGTGRTALGQRDDSQLLCATSAWFDQPTPMQCPSRAQQRPTIAFALHNTILLSSVPIGLTHQPPPLLLDTHTHVDVRSRSTRYCTHVRTSGGTALTGRQSCGRGGRRSGAHQRIQVEHKQNGQHK